MLPGFDPPTALTEPARRRVGREGDVQARFETCIVLHARVGLLEGICHCGALSWEEKRREKEESKRGKAEDDQLPARVPSTPPHCAGRREAGTWVGVDAVGVDGLRGGLPVGLRRQRAEAVHPDWRGDAGHGRRADAGGGARTCGPAGRREGVSAGIPPPRPPRRWVEG